MAKGKTGFDKWVGKKMKRPGFVESYRAARKQLDAVDQLVRTLDHTRVAAGISKAELARAINAKPEIIRRLFTKEGVNPTLHTVIEVAAALGLTPRLVPVAAGDAKPRKPQRDGELPEISLERIRCEPGIATRTAIAGGPVRIVDDRGREVGIRAVPRGVPPELRRSRSR